MSRTLILRCVAILLLAIAAGEIYACDISDACMSFDASGAADDCDRPSGDNCVCCCHHLVPPVYSPWLHAGAIVDREPPPEPLNRTLSRSTQIDHPPQL